jgi:hypothetical protein
VVQSMTTIATNGGTSAVVSAAAIEELRQSLRGQLLRPGESGYDAARTIWNAMIDKRPALVARCAGVADVIRSVNFVRDHGLLTSIRGGSHNVAGNAVCDGCLTIDLSPMNGIRVDLRNRSARRRRLYLARSRS